MDDLSMCAYRAASARAACEDDQNRADRALDVAVAGEPLAALGDPTVLGGGAHEPTPTPYWILDDLLGGLSFERTDHLLDVGCGAGRVLAYAAATQLPCRVTGVELDGRLAARAASWTRGRDGLEVIAGSALDIPLGPIRISTCSTHSTRSCSSSFSIGSRRRCVVPSRSCTCRITARALRIWAVRDGYESGRVRFMRIRLAVFRFSGTLSTTPFGVTCQMRTGRRVRLWYNRGCRSSAITTK